MVCAKVESRTPYVSSWGSSSFSASTPEEAASIWAQRKREEESEGEEEIWEEGKEEEEGGGGGRVERIKEAVRGGVRNVMGSARNNWFMLKEDRIVSLTNALIIGLGGVLVG